MTEPVNLSLARTSSGWILSWPRVEGAFFYNAIRGGLKSLREKDDRIDLGVVRCLEAESFSINTAGYEDLDDPPVGEAFFYLVEYYDGWKRFDGTENAGKASMPSAGACQ